MLKPSRSLWTFDSPRTGLCGWSSRQNRAPSPWTTSSWSVRNNIWMITLHCSYFTSVILTLTVFYFNPGGALLACPVTEAQVKEVKVLLPGSNEVNIWIHTYYASAWIIYLRCFWFRFGTTSTLQRSLKEAGLWVFLSLWTQWAFVFIHII